jgi:hypothetical protein
VEELSLQFSMVIKPKKCTRRRLVNMFSDEPVNWRIQIEMNLCIAASSYTEWIKQLTSWSWKIVEK